MKHLIIGWIILLGLSVSLDAFFRGKHRDIIFGQFCIFTTTVFLISVLIYVWE